MRLLSVFFLLLLSTVAIAGPVPYYGYPDADSLPNTSRILIRDGNSDKNITGARLKSEIIQSIATPSDTPIVKQAATATDPQVRQLVIKDSAGKTTMYVTADGTLVFGP